MGFWHILLGVLFLVICILLVLIVLLQKGKGGGLGSAFGGMGSAAFGTRTGDVLTWVTIVLTAIYLLLALGAGLVFHPPAGLVAMPVFVPQPEAIDEPIKVKMGCSTKGSIIRYTKDGSTPDESSAQYMAPVPVDPGTTLKAKAYREDKGWIPSAVTVGNYPKIKPSTASAPSGLGGLNPALPSLAPLGGAPTTKPATAGGK